MKYTELQLFEERKSELEYKEKKVKGLVDRVTVELQGRESARFTRMARMLKHIDKQIDRLSRLRDNINRKLKGHVEEMFDAEDVTITRVIETVNATLTLSKKTPPGKTSKTDYAKAWGELYELYPDLKEQLDEVVNKYTKVQDVVSKEPGLRVKDKEEQKNESLQEADSNGLLDKISEFGSLLKAKADRWASSYDEKLSSIQSMISNDNLGEASVVSSWIDDLEYNPEDDEVTMSTNGRSYDIADMDEDDYEDWMGAPSKGRHWHRAVKGIKT